MVKRNKACFIQPRIQILTLQAYMSATDDDTQGFM